MREHVDVGVRIVMQFAPADRGVLVEGLGDELDCAAAARAGDRSAWASGTPRSEPRAGGAELLSV
jgi:hypothetical protein